MLRFGRDDAAMVEHHDMRGDVAGELNDGSLVALLPEKEPTPSRLYCIYPSPSTAR